MTTWDALRAIAIESFKVVVAAWPIIVVLALIAIAGLIVGFPLRNPQLRRKVALLLTLYAIPIVVIGIGAILRYDGPRAPQYVEPSAWRFVVLYGVVLGHLLMFIAAVIFLKGARIRAAAVALPSVWLTLCTYFIAGIAIAGVGP